MCAFVRFELSQGICSGSLECIDGSGGGLAHMRLELGEGVFDRIEVGTVGRQIMEFGGQRLVIHEDQHQLAWSLLGTRNSS